MKRVKIKDGVPKGYRYLYVDEMQKNQDLITKAYFLHLIPPASIFIFKPWGSFVVNGYFDGWNDQVRMMCTITKDVEYMLVVSNCLPIFKD